MKTSFAIICFLFLAHLFLPYESTYAQMRQIHLENDVDNEIRKTSFYSPREGYVAFAKAIGYTSDSGRTFTFKPITIGNVNYNNYSNVNLLFAFHINGVKAFDKDNLIVYGDFGSEPSILTSKDGGSTYLLVHHEGMNPNEFTSFTDMVFPQDDYVGYAVAPHFIYKTTNKGASWSKIKGEYNYSFTDLQAVDNNTVIAYGSGLLKTTNGGTTWENMMLSAVPAGFINSAFFLTKDIGWLNMTDYFSNNIVYKTSNAGAKWTLVNDIQATPFGTKKMKFLDENTGYALSGQNTVFKTSNSGATWEPLPRDNDYSYLGYNHNALQILPATQQIWAGGGHGFLEMSTNYGGTPLPKAYFKVDTAGYAVTGKAQLVNFSNSKYSCQWFVNGKLAETTFNAEYLHDLNNTEDTIELVISNGKFSDTAVKYSRFPLAISVTSITPSFATFSTTVFIKGKNFSGVNSVTFGGTDAWNFTVLSDTLIRTQVGYGSTGVVRVTSDRGYGSLAGFVYLSAPVSDLPISVSDTILCKAESITISIQNSEPNVRYDIIDSLNNSYGFVTSNGGTALLSTSPISMSGTYKIKASRTQVNSSVNLKKTIRIIVEHTKSAFTPSRLNILPGEKINLINHSVDAQNFEWVFNQDANIKSSTVVHPANLIFGSTGSKSLSLVSTSENGCKDTLAADYVFVYNKPVPDLTCYVLPVNDTDYNDYYALPASMNKVVLTNDNGYVVSGLGNKPNLKSNIGFARKFSGDGVAYVAKYTGDGILSWFLSINSTGKIYATEKDDNGNVYVLGSCKVTNYLTLPNGDSIKISATPTDVTDYSTKVNGFILKLDSSGNYLWHTILDDPSGEWQGYPVKGGMPARIHIRGDQIAISGQFLPNLAYCRNGIKETLFNLPNSTDPPINYFVLRIKDDGSLLWHTYIELPAVNLRSDVSGVGIDDNNNYYLAGSYEDRLVIHDVDNQSVTLPGNAGRTRSFIVKFSPSGKLIWKVNLTNADDFRDVVIKDIVTSSNGDSYVTGRSTLRDSTQHFTIINSDGSEKNVSFSSYFLFKFDQNGMNQWAVGSRYSYYGSGNSISLKGNDIYTTGVLSNNNESSVTVLMTSVDETNVTKTIFESECFIANYDTNGILKRITTSGKNEDGHTMPNSLVIDKAGNLILSGLQDRPSGGPGSYIVFNDQMATMGMDGFVQKLNNNFCSNATRPDAHAGDDKQICSGDSAKLGDAPVTENNYAWSSVPSGFASAISNPTVYPLTSTTYYLTVTNKDGLINRDTVVISVKQSPILKGEKTKSICPGATTTIGTDSITNDTYSWTSNLENFNSTEQNPTVSPKVNTQYFLKATSTEGCVFNDTITVNVRTQNLEPKVTISASDTTICSAEKVVFTTSTENEDSSPSYQWTINDVIAGTNAGTFTSDSLKDGNIIKVRMTSSVTCITSTDAVSNSIKMTVKERLTPAVSITSNINDACEGTGISFKAQAKNGGNAPYYQWQADGINIGGNSDTVTTTSLKNGTLVKVFMASNAQCTTSDSVESNTIKMILHQGKTPSVLISASANSICAGEKVSFKASVADTSAGVSYQWTLNGSNVGVNEDTYSSTALKNGDTIRVAVQTAAGSCRTGDTVINSNSIGISFLSGKTPSVSMKASANKICTGDAVLFKAFVADTSSEVHYQWKLNGQNVGANANNYNSSTLKKGDVIMVAVQTAAGSCRAGDTILNSNAIEISVKDQLFSKIKIQGNAIVTEGSFTTLMSTVTHSANSSVYQWQDSTGLHTWTNIAEASGPVIVYQPLQTGDKIRCIYKNASSCIILPSISNTLAFVVSESNPSKFGARLYPSPVTSTLIIDKLKPSEKWITVEIYSQTGALIIKKDLTQKTEIKIPVGELPAGTYIAKLRKQNQETVTIKFIKI